MTKGKRTRFSAEFKAKLAKEALKGEETMAQLSVRYGVHANLIAQWKKLAMDRLVGIFSGKPERQQECSVAQIKDLHAKIGQLTVERDFLGQSLRSLSLARRRGMVEAGHSQHNIV